MYPFEIGFCLEVWVQYGKGYTKIEASPDTDCSDIYRIMSQYPENTFYLPNGVKVLLSGRPLRHYTTSNNLTHGLHLDCCLRCLREDGSDDDESEC